MRLIDRCPPGAVENVALDAALFTAAEEQDAEESLRIWESPQPAVIVGRFGALGREIDEGACRADGVPVIRRVSGGGAVVVGRGCLNYSLVLSLVGRSELRHVSASYAAVLGRVVDALGLADLRVAGVCDLAVGDRKIGGSAQRRGRRALLHHGTVLCEFDVATIERYLRPPVRQPAYRAHRRHTDFVMNAPIDAATARAALVRAFVLRSDPYMATSIPC